MYDYKIEIEKRLSDMNMENVKHAWSIGKTERNNTKEFFFCCWIRKEEYSYQYWQGGSEKTGLKFNIQKTKFIASSPLTSWQIDEKTMKTVTDFIFLGSKITVDGDCCHEIKRYFLLGK